MGERTSWFCDRCGKEVRRQSDLRYFHSELDSDVKTKSSGARSDLINGEVCIDCGTELTTKLRSMWEAPNQAHALGRPG